MPPSVYLHIGMPKTGSSALQHFCDAQHEALQKLGCLYPTTGRTPFDHHSQFRFAAAGWDYVFYRSFLKWKRFPHWYGQSPSITQSHLALAEEIAQSGASRVVLSSEWFGIGMRLADIKRLAQLFGELRVRPVMYVRRQDEAIQSLYAELIKNAHMRFSFGFHPRLLMRIPFFNYLNIYQRWSKVFGEQNMIVRCYDQLFEGDINRDFFHLLDLDLSGLELPERINPHLDGESVESLRSLNRQSVGDRQYRDSLQQHAAASANTDGFDLLSPTQARAIEQHFAASNRALAQAAFRRDELFVSQVIE